MVPVAVQSEKLRELVDESAEVEQIATGFTFTEGPIWMADGSLHFSDMPGDKRRRWHPDDGVTVLRDPSNKCNGMTLDNDGNLIVCEHVTSSVVRESRGRHARDARHALAGQGAEQPERRDRRVATARSSSPTRPTAACRASASSASRSSTSRASTACPRAAATSSCSSTTSRSRTACASRPTSRCSTSTTPTRAHIRVFDVGPNHALSNGRVFAEESATATSRRASLVDGMKLDERGQRLRHGPGRRLGLRHRRRAPRRDRGARERRQRQLGRRRLAARSTSPPRPRSTAIRLKVAGNKLGYMH